MDGDTVLVQPGTYVENIDFNGKAIVVASLFLTTGKSNYISETVIDGNENGDVVIFQNGEDSTSILTGFVIRNGAIKYMFEYTFRGGGIYCANSSPYLKNLWIKDNMGSGVFLAESNPHIMNVTISHNKTAGWWYANGSGILCSDSSPYLSNVTITNNFASYGGGIYIGWNSFPVFDKNNRCNIYSNHALLGKDLYTWQTSPIVEIVLDTFTVKIPTDFHAYPQRQFTFDILHGKLEQTNSDLYVSPTGLDSNNGLSFSDPLPTIYTALSKLLPDSLNPPTIHLANGRYSPSLTGERFPVVVQNTIHFSGESEQGVTLDAEGSGGVMILDQTPEITIKNLTITNGGWHPGESFGGELSGVNAHGLSCLNSSPNLINLTISNNKNSGVFCFGSNPVLTNVLIKENENNGLSCHDSNPVLTNVLIEENENSGLYCGDSNPHLSNVTIRNNHAAHGGGIYLAYNCLPVFDLQNRCNIYFNHADEGSDLFAENPSQTIHIAVDTFTVVNPNNYHAFPIDVFTFDILHGRVEQVTADLYVSPTGDDFNNGLSPATSLKTIRAALLKISADSLNPLSIHLGSGLYSPSSNGEIFPIKMVNHVHLMGENRDHVILDAEMQNRVLVFEQINGCRVNNLTIRNGGTAYILVGGVYIHRSNPILQNIMITENVGTGISCYSASPVLIDVDIVGNSSGGMYCSNSSPTLTNVSIVCNTSERNGGGIYCNSNSTLKTKNVLIQGNEAENGGGIYLNISSPELTDITIRENKARSDGGGIYCHGSSARLTNVILAWNSASGKGGGVYSEYLNYSNLMNVTMIGNRSSFDNGIYAELYTNWTIVNSILWNYSLSQIMGNGSVVIAHSNVQGGQSSLKNFHGTVYWLDGNIDSNPLFADSVSLRLSPNSPCIDAGIQDTSITYQNWQAILKIPAMDFMGSAPDMGAVEFDPSTHIKQVVEIIPEQFVLRQNYPNPFNPSTAIEFALPKSVFVTLKVYNLLGEELATLISEQRAAGIHRFNWKSEGLASGVYFYRLQAGEFAETKKLILLR
ncbi:T9SS type A sorting domain-containing protein [candidate division KSB1 bacterium]|nr:T9SS type A sorting domain-containing protein [candidate division KSB1 bacterium]